MRRYEIEHAVLAAALPGPSVAIMLTLCTRIYKDEGIIPQAEQPSLNRLAADTGYDRSTVMRHLTLLEAGGWVIRVRPPVWLARQLHVTTAYAMTVPGGYPQARGNGHRALGALSGEARRTAAEALAAQEDEARRAALPELAADSAGARGGPPHTPDTTDTRHADPVAAELCPHGVAGGRGLMRRTNRIRCPICRQEAAI